MIRFKIGVLALALALPNLANAAAFTFSGNIVNQKDIVRVDFSLSSDATNVRLWTDSFMITTANPFGTNYDPSGALWNKNTGELLAVNDDDDSIDPSQTLFDTGFSFSTLAAGDYFLTVVAYNNLPVSTNISDGFTFDQQAPIAIGEFDQPANSGNARGSFWRVNLDGVDSATGPVNPNPSVVPVPGAIWLFGSALIGFFGLARKKII